MVSKFLPAGFDRSRPVAIIAGKFRYPIIMAEQMRAAGVPVRLIAFEGETESSLVDTFSPKERALIKVGQLGKLLTALKKLEVGYAVMAGQITPGRLFRGLHPDLKALAILASLKERNAESIFGALAREIEKIDVCLLDARVFMDAELAAAGSMTGSRLGVEQDHLAHGIHIAKTIAAEDIGQGVVVARGTVLAVEAFEGTDAMLKRAGGFGARDMIFVKTVKPRQDYRFDVPVFGMKTLEQMIQANIHAAALEADKVLILEKAQVLREAGKRGIHLWGYRVDAA